MPRKRERERGKPIEKGIAVADVGQDVVWDDFYLKVPFSSNPFITRLRGQAILNQALSYNLYWDDLAQRWKPLTDITISTAKILARYYPTDPEAPTELSDLPMRITDKHELRTKDTDLAALIQTLIEMY